MDIIERIEHMEALYDRAVQTGIIKENGIKLQPVVEYLDLCDAVQIVISCGSDHR